MHPRRILVLGGTTEAREAADALQRAGHDVVFSLAGVTNSPVLPETKGRTGGFGGVEGLKRYLHEAKIEALLDATHPFAAIMSRQAHETCSALAIPLARLERPGWERAPNDHWTSVSSLAEAAVALPDGARVLLTTGRKEISLFTSCSGLSGLIRTIEAPQESLPPHWTLLQDRPPFTIADEIRLMRDNGITHLVSKNAGSHSTRAKLDAARELGISVVMVERPIKPYCLQYSDVKSLLDQQAKWLGSFVAKP